jgi:PII-like signaling protein
MGFGKHSVLHTAKILRLPEDLPMVVEIVTSRGKVENFLTLLGWVDYSRAYKGTSLSAPQVQEIRRTGDRDRV